MHNPLRITLYMLLFTHALSTRSIAQCLVAPPAPACTGTEPKAADGETLNTAVSKYYYGASATYNSLTLNGGTLIVCGDLTIDKLTFNTGTLYVLPGASLIIGNGTGTALQLQGGCYFYNYGTITVQRSLLLDGGHASASQPNIFINASGTSTLTVAFDWIVINNPWSWLVNNGKITTHGIVTDPQSSAGSVCLGSGSQIQMSTLINNAPNAYTASGPGCVSVTDRSYLCEALSNNTSVRACLASTHLTDSSCFVSRGHVKAWGSATTFNACSSCGALATLPLSILSFSVEAVNNSNHLTWQTSGDISGFQFQIERSADGAQFTPLIANTPTNSFTDNSPIPGSNFYRIVYSQPITETKIISTIKMVKMETPTLSIYPNPFTTQFSVRLPSSATSAWLELWGTDGKKIQQLYIHNTGNGIIDVRTDQKLMPGLYTLKITTGKQVYFGKLIRRGD